MPYVATMLKNMEALGYTLSGEALDSLILREGDDQLIIYYDILRGLRENLGADKTWSPMYPNFPRQVMEASDAELFFNAISHYLGDWIGIRILPE